MVVFKDILSGYKKGYNIIIVFLVMRDDIVKVLKWGKVIMVVLVNFLKVFDIVWYEIVFMKYYNFGFFKFYLRG